MAKRRKTLREKKLTDKHRVTLSEINHNTPLEPRVEQKTYSYSSVLPTPKAELKTLSSQTVLRLDLLRLAFLVGSIVIGEIVLFSLLRFNL